MLICNKITIYMHIYKIFNENIADIVHKIIRNADSRLTVDIGRRRESLYTVTINLLSSDCGIALS